MRLEDSELIRKVRKSVAEVLGDETKTVKDVNNAFLGAIKKDIESLKKLAIENEAPLKKLIARASESAE